MQRSQANLIFGLGVAFIVLGSIASGYCAKQLLIVLRSLQPAEFPPGYSPRWGLAVNGSVALLGAALAGARGLALGLTCKSAPAATDKRSIGRNASRMPEFSVKFLFLLPLTS